MSIIKSQVVYITSTVILKYEIWATLNTCYVASVQVLMLDHGSCWAFAMHYMRRLVVSFMMFHRSNNASGLDVMVMVHLRHQDINLKGFCKPK